MRNHNFLLKSSILVLCVLSSQAEAAWTLKNGRLVDTSETATMSLEDHCRAAVEAFDNRNWYEAAVQYQILANCFSNHPATVDAQFFLGVAYYNQQEFEFANNAFSSYISAKNHPKFFIEAIEFKFHIAEAFKNGACRRYFSSKKMPKWAPAKELGLKIYDEVIAALPSHDFAARAYFSKGCLHWELREYRESVEAFQMVPRRFPKHELAPEAYLSISRVYLDQSKREFQNPDILAFAEINLRRFQKQFPKEERLCEAEQDLLRIKEVFATGLYETAQFYERTENPRASIIYYQNAMAQFPETEVAQRCLERLRCLIPGYVVPQKIEDCAKDVIRDEDVDTSALAS